MSVTSADEAVSVERVSKTYGGEQPVVALADVDARFLRGTMTAVMGPSGSGKSTLLHCAAGLDRPTSGVIRIGGTDLSSMSEKQLTKLRRSRIGFVFQAFNLVGALTVEQNILLPSRLSRPPPRSVLAHRGGRTGRPGQPAAAPAVGALRWPAAAGGDRPGAGHPARGDLL